MGMKFTNFATSTLASGILAGSTSLSVFAGDGAKFPTLGVGDYFYAVLENLSGTREIIKVTARTGDSFGTIVRAQDGTSALAWNAGDKVELRVVNANVSDFPKLDEDNTFTGTNTVNLSTTSTATTQANGDSSTKVATTAFVQSALQFSPSTPQTILSGPIDANGFAAFGGATGATTVTATGTLIATAAAGNNVNYTGSITNPSWTGLSTNGTMFLYLDITSAGVVTTGSTTLAPTYQWGGTYSTTSGQNTFNIQEMTMKVGNGAAATQVFRVFTGEVTVAGGVVTAIVWYALRGRYYSGRFAVAVSNTYTQSHNLGYPPEMVRAKAKGATAPGAVLYELTLSSSTTDVGLEFTDRNTSKLRVQSVGTVVTGIGTTAVVAEAIVIVDRGW